MTIALALKVGDGLVFGADSAVTVTGPAGTNVYTNAEKVFNLVKGLPIGGVTYGLGGLQNRSMSSVIKDLRAELSDPASPHALHRDAYTMAEVAEHVRRFLYEERYRHEYPLVSAGGADADADVGADGGGEASAASAPEIGVLVGGYAPGADSPELWEVAVAPDGTCPAPRCVASEQKASLQAGGETEAVMRLLTGWSPRILAGLIESGLDPNVARQFLTSQPERQLFSPAMPLQDAIELVEYLVRVTAGFVRFAPGHTTVAEPIDLAAITRHEKFRWVRRKHYFPAALNPPPAP